jgi:cytochrome P450
VTTSRHAAFGLDIHRCIGSHPARMETAVTLEEWLRCIPEFSLVPEAAVHWSAGAVRGPRSLPFHFGGAGQCTLSVSRRNGRSPPS